MYVCSTHRTHAYPYIIHICISEKSKQKRTPRWQLWQAWKHGVCDKLTGTWYVLKRWHAHTHTCTCAHAHAHTHTYTHMHMRVHTHTHTLQQVDRHLIRAETATCTHTHMQMHLHTKWEREILGWCILTFMYVWRCTCVEKMCSKWQDAHITFVLKMLMHQSVCLILLQRR